MAIISMPFLEKNANDFGEDTPEEHIEWIFHEHDKMGKVFRFS